MKLPVEKKEKNGRKERRLNVLSSLKIDETLEKTDSSAELVISCIYGGMMLRALFVIDAGFFIQLQIFGITLERSIISVSKCFLMCFQE